MSLRSANDPAAARGALANADVGDTPDVEALLARLLATPLLAGLDEDATSAVAFEARQRLPADARAGADAAAAAAGDPKPRQGYVRFAAVPEGQVLLHQGDLTTELYVVLAGSVAADQVQLYGVRRPHRTYGAGQWFGEASSLSHHPSLVTCTAAAPTEVAALDHRLFRKLYDESPEFHARVDASYRSDWVGLHLRATPLFRELGDDDLDELQQQARFVAVAKGEPLVREGQVATSFYLVRSGGLRCTTDRGGKTRTLSFYKGNSCLGEHSIATRGGVWPGTYTAMASTELVELPRDVFERLSDPGRRSVTRAANLLLSSDDLDGDVVADGLPLLGGSGAGAAMSIDELHVMVARQSFEGGEALVIDQKKCIRCNLCVESCVAVHEDGHPRISKVGTKIATDEVLITACYHCEVPECMLACGYGAIRRDAQGRIRFEYDSCVGCTDCISACPYGVIRLVAPPPAAGTAAAPAAAAPGERPRVVRWLAGVPFVRRLLGARDQAAPAARGDAGGAAAEPGDDAKPARVFNVGGKREKVTGKTIKCDLCAALPFEACVYNCPTSAIHRRKPESLFLPRRERG